MKETPSKAREAPKPQPDDPAQSERFIATAREVEASENPEDFDRVFARLAIRKRNKKQSR